MLRFAVGLLLAACLVIPAAAQRHGGHPEPWLDNPDLPGILKTAIASGRHARYVGRRVVQFWRTDQARRHEELVTRDGDLTRVEFPEGSRNAGQIIVENRDERRHYFPGRNEVMVQPPRHEESLMRLIHMAQRGSQGRLQFSNAPGGRVAGYPTEQLVISDPNGNVEQRLYIEPRSGVVLKREVFDPGGAKIGYFEFTQIELNPPPFDPSLFRFERRGVRVVTPYDRLREIAARNGFQPVTLPRSTGFLLDEVRQVNVEGQPVLVQSFWSRRGKISLFQVKTAVDPDKLRRFAGKDLHTYSWQTPGASFILVGSISLDELTRLAQKAVAGTW